MKRPHAPFISCFPKFSFLVGRPTFIASYLMFHQQFPQPLTLWKPSPDNVPELSRTLLLEQPSKTLNNARFLDQGTTVNFLNFKKFLTIKV